MSSEDDFDEWIREATSEELVAKCRQKIQLVRDNPGKFDISDEMLELAAKQTDKLELDTLAAEQALENLAAADAAVDAAARRLDECMMKTGYSAPIPLFGKSKKDSH